MSTANSRYLLEKEKIILFGPDFADVFHRHQVRRTITMNSSCFNRLVSSARRYMVRALSASCLLLALAPASGQSAVIGSTAEGFTLFNQDGASVSLNDFAGTGVILDFCAVWCTPCQDFYSIIYPTIPGGAMVQPILLENPDTSASTALYANAWKDAFGPDTLHMNGDEATRTALIDSYLSDLGVLAYPTFVFIDADLTVVGNIVGVRSADDQEWAGYVAAIEASRNTAIPAPAGMGALSVLLLGAGLVRTRRPGNRIVSR